MISIGGFHPAFTPPPGFPTLNRLSISLSQSDVAALSLAAYVAVTSNTLQFGSKAALLVKAGPVQISGTLSFDALIHRNPFGLEIDFAASLAIKVDGHELLGVSVDGTISGPDPWLISGQVKIHLLFISVSVSFSDQLSSGTPSLPPPPTRVIDLLAAEVRKLSNWSALPPAGEAVVTLLPPPPAEGNDEIRAHPLASLTFQQYTVPLGLTLQKFGGTDIAGPTKLALTNVTYGAIAPIPTAVNDVFAPVQFLKFSDSDALSQSSFATYQAGIAFTPVGPDFDQLAVGDAASVECTIEVIDRDGVEPDTAYAHSRRSDSLAACANGTGRIRPDPHHGGEALPGR